MNIISIRGATTVCCNRKKEILKSTKDLILKIEKANKINKENVISIFFTCTDDLDEVYPAKAARELGYTSAGLMCFQEMKVKGSLKKCIRINLLYKTNINQKEAKHVYLENAKELRPDIRGD